MTDEMIEIKYQRARKLLDNYSYDNLVLALEIFEEIIDYKDSRAFRDNCVIKVNELKAQKEIDDKEKYEEACLLMGKKKTAFKLDKAIKIFTELKDYKDSKERLEKCYILRDKISKKDKRDNKRLLITGYVIGGIATLVAVLIILGFIFQGKFQ